MIKNIPLKKGEFLLFTFSNISIDMLVKKHIKDNIITKEERDFHRNINILIDSHTDNDFFEYYNIEKKLYQENELITQGKSMKKPQSISAYHKFTFLIHLLAKNTYLKNELSTPEIKLSSEILNETLGEDYRLFLNTLMRKIIITGESDYKIGKSTRTFFINPKYYNNISCSKSTNIEIKRYIDKSNKLLDERYNIKPNEKQKNYLSEVEDNLIEADNSIEYNKAHIKLYKNYNNCLSRIKLIDINDATKFINDKISNSTSKEETTYYTQLFYKYLDYDKSNYTRLSTDKNKRIYNIITNTPRDFKKYLNIKYTIDINNSHPLLFNKFLLDYYNINQDTYNIITNIKYNKLDNIYYYTSCSNHYVANKSPKELIDKLLKDKIIILDNKLKDVLKYIVMTSLGQLWHELMDECNKHGLDQINGQQVDKHILKKLMFGQVFYANVLRLAFKTKDGVRVDKTYGKLFKSIYPNVFKAVNHYKPKGEESELSNSMMRLESEIFYIILEKLYTKKGLDVINIHDAIVVLDTSDEKYKIEDIENVILEVYHSFNLFPSLDATNYIQDSGIYGKGS